MIGFRRWPGRHLHQQEQRSAHRPVRRRLVASGPVLQLHATGRVAWIAEADNAGGLGENQRQPIGIAVSQIQPLSDQGRHSSAGPGVEAILRNAAGHGLVLCCEAPLVWYSIKLIIFQSHQAFDSESGETLMSFDFATPINRRQPHSSSDAAEGVIEWPSQKWHRYDEDVLPLWVADMDFRSPPEVIEALKARIEHGVYGYGLVPDSLREALCEWSVSRYGWPIEADWQHWLPGVVPALHLASLAFTQPGDGIMTVTPIYPPFLQVARRTGRELQQAALAPPGTETGQWALDLEALEAAVTPRTRLLLWCHPHNPTGRQWRHAELEGLAAFVERYELVVVSDELHCDLLLDEGARHVPLAAAFPQLAARIVTLWAASKTFNLAGLTAACAIISDARLRRRLAETAKGLMPDGNVLGLVASEAAFRHGEAWRQALLEVLRGHRHSLVERVSCWTGVKLAAPQSTYLAWLDLRESNIGSADSPAAELLKQAGVALSDGADFGWPGFARLNFGTTAGQLEQALAGMDRVLEG